MKPEKQGPGRPKHVAEFHQGQAAQNNFAQAMKAILAPKKTAKKKAA